MKYVYVQKNYNLTKEQVLSRLNGVICILHTELCTGIVEKIAGTWLLDLNTKVNQKNLKQGSLLDD